MVATKRGPRFRAALLFAFFSRPPIGRPQRLSAEGFGAPALSLDANMRAHTIYADRKKKPNKQTKRQKSTGVLRGLWQQRKKERKKKRKRVEKKTTQQKNKTPNSVFFLKNQFLFML